MTQAGAARPISFWYSQIVPPPQRRDPLTGRRKADVCIVGGGFTGLWTAYQLLRVDPSLDVVVLEAEVVGFGASGRNGGWVEGRLAGGREHWAALGGRAGAIALERAIQATVDEVGNVTAAEGIDCAFHKGGTLTVAQTQLQLDKVRAEVEEDRMWGLGPEDRSWPPEPLRYLGVRGVNAMMQLADRREWRTDRTSVVGRVAHLISGR